MTADVLKRLGIPTEKFNASFEAMMRVGLERLAALQHPSGGWGWFAALLQRAGAGGVGTLLLPIGLAADVLLPSGGASSRPMPLAALLGLDIATAAGVIAIGQRHLRELALSPLGRSAPLMTALAQSRLHPIRLARALWHPERPLDQTAIAGSRAFGQRASALAWARLLELQRNGLRTGLALAALGLAPLLIVLRSSTYSLGGVVTAAIFSASLGTQLFNDLADHLTRADLELALPAPRWRLLGASLLVRLPVYWAGGLILLLGVGLLQAGARWGDLVGIALWYPLLLLPLLALRGALMFVYPAAVLPGRRDPVQAVVVLLVNGLLTMALLLLSLAPLVVLLALSRLFGVGLAWLWPVVYLTSGLLSAAALGALGWAYGRYEPGEGM